DDDPEDDDPGDDDPGDDDPGDDDPGDDDPGDDDPEDEDDELAALEAELDDDEPSDDDEDDDPDDDDRPGDEEDAEAAARPVRRPKPRRKGVAERLYSGELSFPFIPRRRVFYLLSAVLILASILAVSIRGINPGIEFKGGADFQVAVAVDDDTVATFTDAVDATGLPDMNEVTVRTIGD